MKSDSEGARVSEANKRRQRESDSSRKTKKFVKSGFDMKKF
jgi:hypothetical protein